MMNDDCSVGSLDSGEGITQSVSGSGESSESAKSIDLAKSETRRVNMLRGVVAFVLILATVGASVAVYRFTSNEENTRFVVAFTSHSSKVVDSLKTNIEKQLATMDSMGIALTSYAKRENLEWPFVTMPGYERLVHSALSQIKGLSFLVHHYVAPEQREAWEEYSVANFLSWANESKAFIDGGGYDLNYRMTGDSYEDQNDRRELHAGHKDGDELNFIEGMADHIAANGPDGPIYDPSPGPYMVLWENSPYIGGRVVNTNAMSNVRYGPPLDVAFNQSMASMGPPTNVEAPAEGSNFVALMKSIQDLIETWGIETEYGMDPVGSILMPVIDIYHGEPRIVATMNMYLHWRSLFIDLLPETALGIDAVFSSSCADGSAANFTYQIVGPRANYIGVGDLHDTKYDDMVESINVVDAFNERLASGVQYKGVPLSRDNCDYTVFVYPTDALKSQYVTNGPWIYTVGVVCIFLFAAVVFALYDYTVETRQRLVMRNALKTNAIVSSMFPAQIASRLIEKEEVPDKKGGYMSHKQRIKTFLNNGTHGVDEDEPMADLFPHTTVMIADICGFTSWASSRDPGQVFTLLQTLYGAFDRLASKRKVFKVETVGDSYVSVTGLPEKQDDHALRMARFALECLHKLQILTKELEVTLGPDTGDIQMRFGLHSGPVTAGVLKGERARFQLFGDTINTASRMENSSLPNRIHLSKATAEALKELGRGDMVTRRPEAVHIKGKGKIESYFLNAPRQGSVASSVNSNPMLTRQERAGAKKTQRLIEWNVKILAEQLQKVVARREVVKGKRTAGKGKDLVLKESDRMGKTCLEELEDIIAMPPFDPKIMAKETNPKSIDLGPAVMSQLRLFVEQIASKYLPNPFHNFEHASHVAMSVSKLLGRVVAPDIEVEDSAMDLHDFTHGINSDPLTHFAVVVSALIHDVDHRGVSNMQLGKEDPHMAEKYRNKSIAEQNSCDVAWDILMKPELKELRACIWSDKDELHRFRQTLLKVVLATDIFDKELNDLRKQRWAIAFAAEEEGAPIPKQMAKQQVNVKATIVIEHLIQASDVSHTMQHWHVYRKWNERLFCEMYEAYLAGRMGADPATFWFKGELGFFDNYIIPLTKKLKECNVFGVSSAEYLSYALANREEWEQKGEDIVAEMVAKYQQSSDHSGTILEGVEEEE